MANKKVSDNEVILEEKSPGFTKGQILASSNFVREKDLLMVVLSDEDRYTLADISKKIKEFKERKVK